MRHRFARLTALVALSVAALGLAACGDKELIVREAETEGIYVDVGDLDYQVQISRILNPAIAPDDSYLLGVPDFVQPPDEEETWFGVFLRVANQTDEPHRSAEDIHIVDTQDNEFRPIDLDPQQNAFAYVPGVIEAGELSPTADSAGSLNSAQGRLLLFKVTYKSLGNRPLELIIEGEDGTEAAIGLDL